MAFETVIKKFDALTLLELYSILQLRQEVFIVEQDCPYLDADDKDQAAYHAFIKDEQGLLVAYTRIIQPGISYEKYSSIGRVVTSQKARGAKLGLKIMQDSIDYTKALFPQSNIKISAQVYALDFYRYFGFKDIGDAYLEDNIPHKAMVLKIY